MVNRYARQMSAPDWNQNRLLNTKVAIIGDGQAAIDLLVPLVASGFGKVAMFGVRNKMEILGREIADNKSLERFMKELNPDVRCIALETTIANSGSLDLIHEFDFNIDATNNYDSKKLIGSSYKRSYFISIAADENFGYIDTCLDKLDHRIKGSQSGIISPILAGHACEIMKKRLFAKNEIVFPPKSVYNCTNKDRFSTKCDKVDERDYDFSKCHIAIIGAGNIGTFAGIGGIRTHVGKITLMDMDIVDDTNISRQILYTDSIGELKAPTLARKLYQMGKGRTICESITKPFDVHTKLPPRVDCIFDCTDNFPTRAAISDYATENRVPLISAGIGIDSCQVAFYIPSKTDTINEQLQYDEHAKEDIARGRCNQMPQPSVVWTGQIAGFLMIDVFRQIIAPEKYCMPLGIIRYNGSEAAPFWVSVR